MYADLLELYKVKLLKTLFYGLTVKLIGCKFWLHLHKINRNSTSLVSFYIKKVKKESTKSK